MEFCQLRELVINFTRKIHFHRRTFGNVLHQTDIPIYNIFRCKKILNLIFVTDFVGQWRFFIFSFRGFHVSFFPQKDLAPDICIQFWRRMKIMYFVFSAFIIVFQISLLYSKILFLFVSNQKNFHNCFSHSIFVQIDKKLSWFFFTFNFCTGRSCTWPTCTSTSPTWRERKRLAGQFSSKTLKNI